MANPFLELVSGIGKELGIATAAQRTVRPTLKNLVQSNVASVGQTAARRAGANVKFKPGAGKGKNTLPMRGISGFSQMIDNLKSGTGGIEGTWGGAGMGFLAGGFTANMRADDSQRGVGTFLKGGMWGMAGGATLSKGLSYGVLNKQAGGMLADQLTKAGGKATTGASFAHGAWKAARLVESAEARKYAFASGAMLAGGMMGGDRSRAHGFNANRGNRFSG